MHHRQSKINAAGAAFGAYGEHLSASHVYKPQNSPLTSRQAALFNVNPAVLSRAVKKKYSSGSHSELAVS